MVPRAEHQRPCPCQSVARPRFTSAAAVPQFQASHHIPRPALLTCSVHLGRHRHEEWGPQTSGSVTNTKHILSSSLEQSANLESSAPPQAIESKLPSPRFSCQMHAHLRLPSPSADTSLGLSGTKLYLNRHLQLPCVLSAMCYAVFVAAQYVYHICICWGMGDGAGAWADRQRTRREQVPVKPRAAEVYLRPSNLGGLAKAQRLGASLRFS